jgi:nucleoside-diphosphate-sugar epimerase
MQPVLRQPLPGTVVVTGASGFIGGQLRAALLASGADVISLVRPDSPPVTLGRAAAVDYGDEASLRRVFEQERPDYVFHVAGATKGVTKEDYWRGNVLPTQSLVRALNATEHGLSRFVLVSSLTAFGPSHDGPPVSERQEPRPVELYGQSKLEAERVVQREAGRLPWTIVRPAGVYGPADVDSFVLFRSAHLRVNLFYGNAQKRASMVYVDDLVRALVAAAQAESTLGKGYFIADGESYTWETIQRHIARAVGRRGVRIDVPSFVVPLAARAGEWATALDKRPRLMNRQKALLDAQQAWLCSIEAAQADFGFAPEVDMAEGTRRAYAWYRANSWL